MKKTPEYQEAVEHLTWWLRLCEETKYTMWSIYAEQGGEAHYVQWCQDTDAEFRQWVRDLQMLGADFEEAPA